MFFCYAVLAVPVCVRWSSAFLSVLSFAEFFPVYLCAMVVFVWNPHSVVLQVFPIRVARPVNATMRLIPPHGYVLMPNGITDTFPRGGDGVDREVRWAFAKPLIQDRSLLYVDT